MESNTQDRDSDMKEALQDLEALMSKAKDMVKLANELNERLTAATKAAADTSADARLHAALSGTTKEQPEEATFIRSSLSQLGLQMTNAPVTMDMMKDERNWLESLTKELSKILQGSPHLIRDSENARAALMDTRGIIALDEVWGGWNRARGVGKTSNIVLKTCLKDISSSHPSIDIPPSDLAPSKLHLSASPAPFLRFRLTSFAHPSLCACGIRGSSL